MKRDLALGIVVDVVAALCIVAIAGHVTVYLLVREMAGETAALAVLFALLAADTVALLRVLGAVSDVVVGDGGEDGRG